jgi:hypothetical protein
VSTTTQPAPPGAHPGGGGTPALRFAETARRVGAATRAVGLAVPAFRCPPRVAGAERTIRRYPGGTVVSVRLRDRPFEEVVTDMVEGVVVANRLSGDAALRLRTALLDAAHRGAGASDQDMPVPSNPSARMAERQTQAA